MSETDVERRRAGDANTDGRGPRPLSTLTTIGLGGPAERLVEARSESEIIDAVQAADDAGRPLLVLGGGSNLVIADAGFDGVVVRIMDTGVTIDDAGARAHVRVHAGERWDELVALCVEEGLAGIECLSGIPGLAGATPLQNVGAYGQQVADTILSVRAYDREACAVVQLQAEQCEFAYRTSIFRRSSRYVVLAVEFSLERSPLGLPVRYAQLADVLGTGVGERAFLADMRNAVIALRRGKGLVADPEAPDPRSAGSFFLNPSFDRKDWGALKRRIASRFGGGVHLQSWPDRDGRVKTSAAWLIEHAGFERGYGRGRVGISELHSLVLVNRGGASTEELLALAREVRAGVYAAFGVTLVPEPVLVGVTL